jgi:hypothetical protein
VNEPDAIFLFQFLGWLVALTLGILLTVAACQLFGIKRRLDDMLTIAQHDHKQTACPACQAARMAEATAADAERERKICDPPGQGRVGNSFIRYISPD